MRALKVEPEITYLSVDKIAPNPYQPRKFFDRDSIEELSKSIKEYGVMQPISVRLINGAGYELVAGERRLRASRMAQLETIPAIVVNIKEQDSGIIAMIENIQREDLNFIEEALGFSNLLQDYNFTQEELAKRMGKSQSAIANKIRILKLSKAVQKLLIDSQLTERHGRALLRLNTPEAQIEVLDKIIKEDLNVKQTENLIERVISGKTKKKKGSKIKQIIKDVRLFSNTVKQGLDIMKQSGYDTDYSATEVEGGMEISIMVRYPKKECAS